MQEVPLQLMVERTIQRWNFSCFKVPVWFYHVKKILERNHHLIQALSPRCAKIGHIQITLPETYEIESNLLNLGSLIVSIIFLIAAINTQLSLEQPDVAVCYIIELFKFPCH